MDSLAIAVLRARTPPKLAALQVPRHGTGPRSLPAFGGMLSPHGGTLRREQRPARMGPPGLMRSPARRRGIAVEWSKVPSRDTFRHVADRSPRRRAQARVAPARLHLRGRRT